MRRLKHQVIWAVISTLLISVFMNCGPSFQMQEKVSGSSMSASTGDATTAAQAKSVLQSRCASCHTATGSGGLSNIMDESALKSGGWVVPGNANNSPLLRRVYDGTMPPGQPLSNAEQTALYNWVVAMGSSTGSGGGIGAPGGPVAGGPTTPTPTPPMGGGGGGALIEPTFTNVNNTILIPRCVGCHGSAGGVSYANYTATLRTVSVGSPAASRLYASVNNGSMPRGSNMLSADERKLILDWITLGAKND